MTTLTKAKLPRSKRARSNIPAAIRAHYAQGVQYKTIAQRVAEMQDMERELTEHRARGDCKGSEFIEHTLALNVLAVAMKPPESVAEARTKVRHLTEAVKSPAYHRLSPLAAVIIDAIVAFEGQAEIPLDPPAA
ncbi:hypothetical protein [Lichenifustis flavocetrariae]|uniref:Uncharacterized protein n=1 Tax=Lichenifustis flavocetrariae TaxID=2949735 RepID=A0AA42CNN6_9HYPH|nr:hypothetical protein [Lichenifustis flavocetrariae]MCW6512991.1 hypothetical protein [Lichenifustis flavocetrariae]